MRGVDSVGGGVVGALSLLLLLVMGFDGRDGVVMQL
jgi:hypothetical protein